MMFLMKVRSFVIVKNVTTDIIVFFIEEDHENVSEVKEVEKVLFEEFCQAQENRLRKQAQEYEALLANREKLLQDINEALDDSGVHDTTLLSNEALSLIKSSKDDLNFEEFMESLNGPDSIQKTSRTSYQAAVISDKKKKTADAASAILTLGVVSLGLEFMSLFDIVVTTPLLFAGAKTLTERYLKKRDE